MRHEADHDPIMDWPRCWTCHQAISTVWSRWRETFGVGPSDWQEAIGKMRYEARMVIAGLEGREP